MNVGCRLKSNVNSIAMAIIASTNPAKIIFQLPDSSALTSFFSSVEIEFNHSTIYYLRQYLKVWFDDCINGRKPDL